MGIQHILKSKNTRNGMYLWRGNVHLDRWLLTDLSSLVVLMDYSTTPVSSHLTGVNISRNPLKSAVHIEMAPKHQLGWQVKRLRPLAALRLTSGVKVSTRFWHSLVPKMKQTDRSSVKNTHWWSYPDYIYEPINISKFCRTVIRLGTFSGV